MSWTHEHSWKLPDSPARVFAALTDPLQLNRWFAERVEIGLRVGGPFRFWGKHTLGTPGASEAEQAVIAIEPERRLEFSWPIGGVPTEVRIGLAGVEGGGTQLTLHHVVTGDLPWPRPKALIDDHWRLAFGNLAAHLGGGAGIVLPDYGDPDPKVELSILIAAPRESVFRALIEPEAINRWFGTKAAVVDPRVGGRYSLGWKYQIDGNDVTGGPTVIKELIPNERLVLDWPDWRGDPAVPDQWIGFYLETEGTGTRVTFVHGGFLRQGDQSDYPFGWLSFLDDMAAVARTIPGP